MPDNLQSATLPMADLERNRNRAAIRRAPESAALLAFLVAEIIFFSLSSPYFLTWETGSMSSPRFRSPAFLPREAQCF